MVIKLVGTGGAETKFNKGIPFLAAFGVGKIDLPTSEEFGVGAADCPADKLA